ncbi:MAG: hypothetical protein MET45_12065 [Nostoc sp. LLA-1]|nr:hypothetical protein [Cyanocohniella sp. LLY]
MSTVTSFDVPIENQEKIGQVDALDAKRNLLTINAVLPALVRDNQPGMTDKSSHFSGITNPTPTLTQPNTEAVIKTPVFDMRNNFKRVFPVPRSQSPIPNPQKKSLQIPPQFDTLA